MPNTVCGISRIRACKTVRPCISFHQSVDKQRKTQLYVNEQLDPKDTFQEGLFLVRTQRVPGDSWWTPAVYINHQDDSKVSKTVDLRIGRNINANHTSMALVG